MLLEADWILPLSGPPIHKGAVVVKRGRIVELGKAAELREEQWAERVLEFPGCVLMPGFVNAHTHLDYSAFRDFSEPSGFGRWMLNLLLARRRLSTDDYAASALWGAFQCARSGITCVADASYDGWTVARAAHAAGLRARIYVELFGLDDAALPVAMKQLEERLDRVRTECEPPAALLAAAPFEDDLFAGPGVTASAAMAAEEAAVAKAKEEGQAVEPPCLVEPGISPHAPYTVSARLYREAARVARRAGLRMTTHLAESEAEVELLSGQKSVIVKAYAAANLWTGQRWKAPMARPVQYLAEVGVLSSDMLAVHAVQTDAADIATLAAGGAAVAHCPRSNLRLQCGAAPVLEMMAAGITVGLGTDSLASNNSFDMFAEMRAALAVSRARAAAADAVGGAPRDRTMTEEPRDTLTADSVLRMATSDGARALGWDQLTGTLAAGKRADIIAVRLPASTAGPADAAGLADLLVAGATAADVRMTMVDGKVVFDAEDRPAIPEEVAARYSVARKKLGLQ